MIFAIKMKPKFGGGLYEGRQIVPLRLCSMNPLNFKNLMKNVIAMFKKSQIFVKFV